MDNDSEFRKGKEQAFQGKIRFKYVIVSSRSPRFCSRSWNPTQYFTNTSLVDFMNATQLSHISTTGVFLRLQAPGIFMEEAVRDNNGFDEVKFVFSRVIVELKKRLISNMIMRVILQIEPLYSAPKPSYWLFDRYSSYKMPSHMSKVRRQNTL